MVICLFICFILMLYTEFQSSSMPRACQKVCGGMVVVVWCVPILVFSLGQAEQFLGKMCPQDTKYNSDEFVYYSSTKYLLNRYHVAK